MSVNDENRMATTEMMMALWALGVNMHAHCRNEEMLEEANVEPIAMVTRKDTVRRDMKYSKIREEWATEREKEKGLYNTRYAAHGDGDER